MARVGRPEGGRAVGLLDEQPTARPHRVIQPPQGPGRVDTFDPPKALLGFSMDTAHAEEMNGVADFPSVWNQKARKGMWLHWEGNNCSVDERNLSAGFGTGATPATIDVAQLILKDSAHLQQSDVERENRRRQRQGKDPIEPLYAKQDVERLRPLYQKLKYDHPTQKPLELMRRPILNHLKRGEAVYDAFLGSGTTLAAAEATGRVCCGIEIDPKYVDVVIERWQKMSGKAATLDGDGRTFVNVRKERLGGS